MGWVFFGVGLLIIGGLLYAALIERHWIDFAHVRVELERLPQAWDGVKLVLLSDLHLGFYATPKKLSAAVHKINAKQPDLICLAGDLLDKSTSLGALEWAVPILSQLHAPLGKWAIFGNHDYKSGVAQVGCGLAQSGFRVLKNEHVVLEKDADKLYLLGLDDVLKGKPNLAAALAEIPAEACCVLLVHEPDFADRIAPSDARIDLQLSGHSHGGQICLPGVGPLITTKLGKKYHTGLHRLAHVKVYTSRGFGTTGLPFRFFCRPEVAVLELRQGNKIGHVDGNEIGGVPDRAHY